MNLLTTLSGGLKIIIEEPYDWEMFEMLLADASITPPRDLAKNLGSQIQEPEDWEAFVLPDLESHFSSALDQIYSIISEAKKRAGTHNEELILEKHQAQTWYLVLNQARLNLEETYRFGSREDLDKRKLTRKERPAFARDQFYSALQGALLSYVFPE